MLLVEELGGMKSLFCMRAAHQQQMLPYKPVPCQKNTNLHLRWSDSPPPLKSREVTWQNTLMAFPLKQVYQLYFKLRA